MDATARTDAAREAVIRKFIADLERELIPLHLEYHEATWKFQVSGDASAERESAELETRIRKVLARPESFRVLDEARSSGGVTDPLLARQLAMLYNEHRSQQIPPAHIERIVALEKQLEGRFNRFRAQLDGEAVSDNALREVLRHSTDSQKRRRAWEASKQVGAEVCGDLLKLVGLRNESARLIGFPNYYSMMLTLDEFDETELFALLDRVEAGTRPIWHEYKRDLDQRLAVRFGVQAEELAPWHYSDPFFQEAPAAEVSLDPFFEGKQLEALTQNYFEAVGFEIGDLLARSDLYEKAGKCPHAFCMSMDRGIDIRVLCNLRSNEGWMSTMLHEFGHAVYDKYVDPSLPYFLRAYAHLTCTEASAMLFGRLSKNPQWLVRYAGAPAAEAEGKAAALARAIRGQLVVQTRWMLVMCHMERALYRDPSQDLDTLWWDLVERFQNLKRPAGRTAPDWAAKIHFSVAPVYYHNYLLGEMTASQLQAWLLRDTIGPGADPWGRYVSSPDIGRTLREKYYALGRRFDWRETIARATGKPLDVDAYVDELAGRV
ncbi:MAG: peptidase M3 [Candidatus Eisenbacteria bacterium]|uniref:Peptidase M3 n=1 Tax=Eiseniibacteriota bacterium TaxID=2212470 RepID=A0A849SKB9_UNCEI|nr:peptidase M3 [Candidatus Eisenbacteria bacterium]